MTRRPAHGNPARRAQLLAALALLCSGALPVRAQTSDRKASPVPVQVRLLTELGPIDVQLEPAAAPVTVANFLRYVDAGLLDRAVAYRIVTLANQASSTAHKIEVVQWGLNARDGAPPPFPPIAHETTEFSGLRHLDGTLSMARTQPGTAASEFFFCIGDQPELDFGGRRNPDGQGFAAFGRVVRGLDVLRALHARGDAGSQYLARPLAITEVRRLAR